MSTLALEIQSIFVMDFRRPVQADANIHFELTKNVCPLFVDEHRVGADAALYLTTGSLFDIEQFFLKRDEAMFGKKQGLSPMKYDHEMFQPKLGYMLLEPFAERVFGFNGEHRRLLVHVGVAKPVAICAFDIAAGCELHQQEREYRHFPRQGCGRVATGFVRYVEISHRAADLCFEAYGLSEDHGGTRKPAPSGSDYQYCTTPRQSCG